MRDIKIDFISGLSKDHIGVPHQRYLVTHGIKRCYIICTRCMTSSKVGQRIQQKRNASSLRILPGFIDKWFKHNRHCCDHVERLLRFTQPMEKARDSRRQVREGIRRGQWTGRFGIEPQQPPNRRIRQCTTRGMAQRKSAYFDTINTLMKLLKSCPFWIPKSNNIASIRCHCHNLVPITHKPPPNFMQMLFRSTMGGNITGNHMQNPHTKHLRYQNFA
ncbi:hypothetical protein SE16_12220 [Ardenticatena maritima]|uniref:Uncharacterized protein n=1 Tax=Ardenticatena maritima TaxID=872965 RepID=A0A0P6YAZ5_9CHLR|nr:hypothetical protein SE16_12220 [Ardenticatena maritima]